MLIEKVLTQEQLKELFEEQKAVFSNYVEENNKFNRNEKYRPRIDFYGAGKKIATLTFPSFKDYNDMAIQFDRAAYFPKLIKADESILFLDVTTEVTHKTNGTTIDSDVFVCIKTSTNSIRHEASPYYMHPDVHHPVWNNDYELNEANVFGMHDLIAALNFAITSKRHSLELDVFVEFLRENGFEVDFHHPFTLEVLLAVENKIYF